MRRCPYCPYEVTAEDPREAADEEVAHMNAEHPDVVAQRLTDAGFVRDERSGGWIDTLAHD